CRRKSRRGTVQAGLNRSNLLPRNWPLDPPGGRDANPLRALDSAHLGMAALPDRISLRRLFRIGSAAARSLADPVHHVSDPGMAGGWLRRGQLWRRASRSIRGVVVRFRLFRPRALLGRQCVSGRRQNIRIAPSACCGCLAGGNGALHGIRAGARPSLLDAGAARIVALAAALALSEWLRGHLFSGFPWNALG